MTGQDGRTVRLRALIWAGIFALALLCLALAVSIRWQPLRPTDWIALGFLAGLVYAECRGAWRDRRRARAARDGAHHG